MFFFLTASFKDIQSELGKTSIAQEMKGERLFFKNFKNQNYSLFVVQTWHETLINNQIG